LDLKTIYLHVGMSKTGTSALQSFLRDNRSILEQKGYVYPDFSVKFAEIQKKRNAHFLKYITEAEKPEGYYQCNTELQECLKEHDNIILTDEALWGYMKKDNWWECYDEWAKSIDAQIKIIVYLRRQEDWIESIWTQKIKGYVKWTITFEEYLKIRRYDVVPLNYEEALQTMEEHIGIENMVVKSYDFKYFKNGSICDDFLDAIGLEMTDEYDLNQEIVNSTMPYNAVEVKRMINMNDHYKKTKSMNLYLDAIKEAYSEEEIIANKQKKTFYTKEQLESISAEYKESNENVARKYLHREDGKLFSEKKDVPEWDSKDQNILEETVRILTGADMYLYDQVVELREELKKVENRTLYGLLRRIKRKIFNK